MGGGTHSLSPCSHGITLLLTPRPTSRIISCSQGMSKEDGRLFVELYPLSYLHECSQWCVWHFYSRLLIVLSLAFLDDPWKYEVMECFNNCCYISPDTSEFIQSYLLAIIGLDSLKFFFLSLSMPAAYPLCPGVFFCSLSSMSSIRSICCCFFVHS